MTGKADIFISYSQADRSWVKELATAFEAEGFSTWWDPKQLPGTKYRDAIKRELDGAKAVVVVWSSTSVESDWVRDEAEDARQCRKLVPVLKDPVPPPHGFRQLQTANLSQWRGRRENPEFRSLMEGIGAMVSADGAVPPARLDPVPAYDARTAISPKQYGMAAAVLALLLGAGVYTFGHRPASAPATSGSDATEISLWNAVATSGDPQQLGDYLARYPNGAFAAVARSKIAALKQAAVVPKPAPAATIAPVTPPPVQARILPKPKPALVPATVAAPVPAAPAQPADSAAGHGPGAGWWRSADGSGDAHFGGPPFAYYHTSLTRVSLAIELDDSGKIANASAQAMMTETSSDPAQAPIAPNQHNFTMTGAQQTGQEIGIQLAGASGNQPHTRASFRGQIQSGAITGTLVVDRNDVGGVTPQVLWTISIPMTLTR